VGVRAGTSEVTSIQLEWKWLSQEMKEPKWGELTQRVSEIVDALPKEDSLVPFYINVDSGRFTKTTLTLGARADSYYEYLLKQWLLSGKSSKPKEHRFLKAYEEVCSAWNLPYELPVLLAAAVVSSNLVVVT
jgi:hypothetical protein